jgi:hypothetical protein
MKRLLTLVLIGLAVTGCSPVSQTGAATRPAVVTGTPSANLASGNASLTATTQGASSQSLPLSVTVRPPAVPIGPVPGTPVPGILTPMPVTLPGWQTFTSPSLGVAVDYPADWAAAGQTDGATFTSAQGGTIQLQAGQAGVKQNSGKLECTTLINTYGQSGNVCVDAGSQRYSASFVLKSNSGSNQLVTLSTTGTAALEVYKSMLNTVRPAQ